MSSSCGEDGCTDQCPVHMVGTDVLTGVQLIWWRSVTEQCPVHMVGMWVLNSVQFIWWAQMY